MGKAIAADTTQPASPLPFRGAYGGLSMGCSNGGHSRTKMTGTTIYLGECLNDDQITIHLP